MKQLNPKTLKSSLGFVLILLSYLAGLVSGATLFTALLLPLFSLAVQSALSFLLVLAPLAQPLPLLALIGGALALAIIGLELMQPGFCSSLITSLKMIFRFNKSTSLVDDTISLLPAPAPAATYGATQQSPAGDNGLPPVLIEETAAEQTAAEKAVVVRSKANSFSGVRTLSKLGDPVRRNSTGDLKYFLNKTSLPSSASSFSLHSGDTIQSELNISEITPSLDSSYASLPNEATNQDTTLSAPSPSSSRQSNEESIQSELSHDGSTQIALSVESSTTMSSISLTEVKVFPQRHEVPAPGPRGGTGIPKTQAKTDHSSPLRLTGRKPYIRSIDIDVHLHPRKVRGEELPTTQTVSHTSKINTAPYFRNPSLLLPGIATIPGTNTPPTSGPTPVRKSTRGSTRRLART